MTSSLAEADDAARRMQQQGSERGKAGLDHTLHGVGGGVRGEGEGIIEGP
jgi:hypothetical protein